MKRERSNHAKDHTIRDLIFIVFYFVALFVAGALLFLQRPH
jgi:hypothetical protein